MTKIAAKPFLLNNVDAALGTDTYEEALTSVLFTPTVNIIKWRGLSKNSRHRFVQDPEWTCAINFAQDWASSASLSRRLKEATPGEEVEFVFAPQSGGRKVKATIMLVPGSIGGSIDTVPESAVTFEVIGQPEFIEPDAPEQG